MTLIDTSAWIEFLRDTGSVVCNHVEALLESDIAVCDAIRMEVLAGARNERHLTSLRGLLARATVLPTPILVAVWQAMILAPSLVVTARSNSARSARASLRIGALAPFPVMTKASSRSLISSARRGLFSMTTTSWPSSDNRSAI